MRIARFLHADPAAARAGSTPGTAIHWGVVEGADSPRRGALSVAAIDGHPFGPITYTGQRWPLGDVRLLSPVLPSKVIAVARNYAEHARELGNEVPAAPLIFLKPSTSVIGDGDAIRLPASSSEVHFEGELAVVIGRPARSVDRSDALSYVLGYAAGNDVTARDQQRADAHFTRAKSYDSFCPFGPWIETEFDPADVRITTSVNGVIRQDGRTKQMIHDVAEVIAYSSAVMTLLPGDVILTGTPAGVGPIVAGDTVTVEVEGIGALVNPVRSA
ncbi:MAG TPA: fumarylacetoacetate hydrolase family protein [Jatrophihabitantaceae bacterium]|jgi:2-keto-4-pentenoate hydratase/2-oxohepta-3-ene-1,7-dioic acid hydratase in catechol pathway|nr:fumarylacetoacetate hydrolase family protein [Jatrophihabitantaceae bacterium]